MAARASAGRLECDSATVRWLRCVVDRAGPVGQRLPLMTPTIKRVCVFCGASPGRVPGLLEAARAVGQGLARAGVGLVYGGSPLGMMGAVADGALEAGGHVIGILPDALSQREQVHPGLSELQVVRSMHLRKARMVELSDAFVALPGGLGTMDELFETWTWAQIGLHQKPLALLNVQNFFAPLVALTGHMVETGFLPAAARDLVAVEDSVPALLRRLGIGASEAAHTAPVADSADASADEARRAERTVDAPTILSATT